MSTALLLLAASVSLVLVLGWMFLKRQRLRAVEQKETWEMNAGVVETIIRAFDHIMADHRNHGVELDDSVFDLSDGTGLRIDDERIPAIPTNRVFFYIQAPEHALEMIAIRGTTGERLFIWKSRINGRISYGSNFVVKDEAKARFPFSQYPKSNPEAVGMMHEMLVFSENLGLQPIGYPRLPKNVSCVPL